MAEKLTFQYDRDGDILYITKREPYPEQESEEVGDEVIARLNPTNGEVEGLEVLFFSTRLLRRDLLTPHRGRDASRRGKPRDITAGHEPKNRHLIALSRRTTGARHGSRPGRPLEATRESFRAQSAVALRRTQGP